MKSHLLKKESRWECELPKRGSDPNVESSDVLKVIESRNELAGEESEEAKEA